MFSYSLTLSLASNKNTSSLYHDLNKASEQLPVQFFASYNAIPNQNFNIKQALSVRVRIKF